MRSVSGQIRHRESGSGLPNLTVVAIDANSDYTKWSGGDAIAGQSVQHLESLPGRRIGTAITDRNGDFELAYDWPEDAKSTPNIVLIVTTAEGDRPDGSATVLHAPRSVRVNAAADEQFLISLDNDTLLRARLQPTAEFEPLSFLSTAISHIDSATVPLSDRADVKVSDTYRQSRDGHDQRRREMRKPPQSARLRLTNTTVGDTETALTFNEDAKRWEIEHDGATIEVQYRGERRPDDAPANLALRPGINYAVDLANAAFVVIRTPFDIGEYKVPDNPGPGELVLKRLKAG